MTDAPDTHHVRRPRALAMLALANLFWALSFPLTKAVVLLQRDLLPSSPGFFVTANTLAPRFLIALVLLVAISRGARKKGPPIARRETEQGLILGIVIGVGMLLQVDGLRFTSASTSAFLTQFYCILIPAILAIRRRRSLSLSVWACCVLVLAGMAILAHFDWRSFHLGRGESETIVASLIFMGGVFCLDSKAYAENRSENVTLVFFIVLLALSTAVLAASAPNLQAVLKPWTCPAWLGMTLGLGLFSTLGAFWIMNHWQRYIGATEAGIIYCMEPLFASILALFLPKQLAATAGIAYANETATVSLVIGGTLVTAANVIIQLRTAGGASPSGPSTRPPPLATGLPTPPVPR